MTWRVAWTARLQVQLRAESNSGSDTSMPPVHVVNLCRRLAAEVVQPIPLFAHATMQLCVTASQLGQSQRI